jgi:hypothetical protein
VLHVFVLAVVNLGLGFALAMVLGWRHRCLHPEAHEGFSSPGPGIPGIRGTAASQDSEDRITLFDAAPEA